MECEKLKVLFQRQEMQVKLQQDKLDRERLVELAKVQREEMDLLRQEIMQYSYHSSSIAPRR